MIGKIVLIMTVVASITNSGEAHHRDDEYRQYQRLLKEARKAERQRQFNENFYQGSSQVSQYQQRPSGGSSSNGGGSNSPPNPILTPGSSGNGGNFGTVGSAIPPAGGSSSNYPPVLPNFPSGSQIAGQLGVLPNLPNLPPYPIEQVNRGVSTILNGVRSFDLGQILRGAFVFPRNENVRSVANNVIDSIFGAQRSTPNNGR